MTIANPTKENIYLWYLPYSSEIQSITIMMGHGEMQEVMVLDREL